VHKLASKVRGRFCDWYLLDSLDVTNKTPGTLGAEQLEWLEKSLKAAADRPALVMVHHNPQPAGLGKVSGLHGHRGVAGSSAGTAAGEGTFFRAHACGLDT
jgi:hypothetical protein